MTEKEPPQMTVGVLRKLLEQYSDETLVFSDGCDCVGPACGIEFDPDDKSILISRKGME